MQILIPHLTFFLHRVRLFSVQRSGAQMLPMQELHILFSEQFLRPFLLSK